MSAQMIPFQFNGHIVRAFSIDGEPAFVGKDVCERLGYADPTNAMKQHCKGVVKRHPLQTPGGVQKLRVLGEPDVLRLIVKSTLPEAVEFERLLFEEILPSIRKNGNWDGGPSSVLAPLQAQIASLTEEVRSLVITRPTGVAVCAGMTAKEWLIEYKCEQKGRNPIVRQVSANLRNLALRQGIVLDKCARTGTWVFPSSLARPYMESMGRIIIRKHNDLVLNNQPGLTFPKPKKRKAGTPPFAKKPEPVS